MDSARARQGAQGTAQAHGSLWRVRLSEPRAATDRTRWGKGEGPGEAKDRPPCCLSGELMPAERKGDSWGFRSLQACVV